MALSADVKQYLVVTASYWAFTITDGALRMLVVLYFHNLGYSPLEIASLFLLYEFFGVVTNLVGGWLAARLGLNTTMQLGLGLQIIALGLLCVDPSWLSVPYVMFAQALSGIAKDLNKMSAKSSIKLLVPKDAQGTLYKWVAILTGSKNALKGAGFFIGAALLALLGFQSALQSMALALVLVLGAGLFLLRKDLGKTKFKPKFTELLSKSSSVNTLSGARMFLFGARDVWFVVALPVFFQMNLGWSHAEVGTFMALWIIGYGVVQSLAPAITGMKRGRAPDGYSAMLWVSSLALIPLLIAYGVAQDFWLQWTLVGGLMIFGALFAVNSAVHSYLIVSYADEEGVSLDVGFYYMSNAAGRLIGTILSGALFQYYGLVACLVASTIFLVLATIISIKLPRHQALAKS